MTSMTMYDACVVRVVAGVYGHLNFNPTFIFTMSILILGYLMCSEMNYKNKALSVEFIKVL